MNILVTAGGTLVPIDKVRCITNVFTGRTGASIALHAHDRGHTVTLLTSTPEAVADLREHGAPTDARWLVRRYRTFDDLEQRLMEPIRSGSVEVVVHTAAVSDYRAAGVYTSAPGTQFDPTGKRWVGTAPALIDRAAAKVKSDEEELWLRLVQTPKIVDQIRSAWGFRGVLVKFKLEVAVSDDELLKIAEPSRVRSNADLMVANTVEGAQDWAFVGPLDGRYERVSRRDLATRLLEAIEQRQKEQAHG